MATAVYPGSFDPVTKGHLDIIERAASLVDELVVAVLKNNAKTPLFSEEERVKMIKDVTGHIPKGRVESFSGLSVEFAKQCGAKFIVRGLRAVRPPMCPQALHQRAAGRFAFAASPLDPVCLGYLDSAGWPALAACRTHRLVAFPAGLFVAGNRPRPIATGDRRAVGTDQACRAGGGGDARGCVRRMHGAQRPPRLDCAG